MKAWTIALCAGGSLLGLGATSHAAPAPLSPAEADVCQSVKQCADILSRHDPRAFDYDVLAAEFARFGPKSVPALAAMASGKDRAHVDELLGRGDRALAYDVARRLLADRDAAARAVGGNLLMRIGQVGVERPPLPFPVAARAVSESPSTATLSLLEAYPFEQSRPVYVEALGSGEPGVVFDAYSKLFAASPPDAFAALITQMRATDDLPTALAIGQMIARRDPGRPDGFYAKMLDDIAGDRGYSQAMRDGARAGSLSLRRPDAPLTVSADLAAQLERLEGTDALMTAFSRVQLARAGQAILPSWLEVARRNPERLRDMLIALNVGKADPLDAAPFVELGLRQNARGRTVIEAIRTMAWSDTDRFTPALRSLAASHPFDTVRYAAQAKLDRDLDALDDRYAVLTGVTPPRSRAQYCERGDRIDPYTTVRQLPPLDAALSALPVDRKVPSLGPARTAFAGATRWLIGFDKGEFGGGLIGYDYADGRARRILSDNVRLILPPAPVPLGKQPDRVWIMGGSNHMGLNSAALYAVAPDGPGQPSFVSELPQPVRDAARLADGSLFLSFHDPEARFETRTIGRVLEPGWEASHPPLRLLPDGRLMPGCAGEALVGEAPSLFQP